MQRVLPETTLEKNMMCMGAVFIEENHLLDDLYEIIGSDLVEGQELTGDAKDQVLDEVGEYFFRLDLNWGHEIKADCIEILQEYWGVKSREQAFQALEQIRQQGHRVKFNVLRDLVPADGDLSAHNMEKFKQIFTFDFADDKPIELTDEDFKKLAQWFQRTLRFLKEPGILGWDAARFVHLARLSFVAGYMDDNEAWAEILKMAPIADGKFDNWMEFSQSFLIGRTFWSGSEDPVVKKICERLLGHPASPWNFYTLS
ncbi:DUF1266 domain-containing protein [Bdellovibrio sp. SKB1291214]|uniref:DUF1266 domain-containing protein n=1 Tax=Bdellovibrio sp. SKB1291214 TaxID=1732569 RepID=UPI000B516BB1|nr:DUF1266 domain-containing protein [Bdellovibrio sp. SKB1291214]UYL09178.1 DUF1266 domain-containing protein [Bdellovibrio sp. SKB1291214]